MNPVILPVLGANMTHGTIRAWYKAEGEPVAAGEILFEVETDKVNAEVEAEASGLLRKILVQPGERVPVLAVLALIGEAGEPLADLDVSAEDPGGVPAIGRWSSASDTTGPAFDLAPDQDAISGWTPGATPPPRPADSTVSEATPAAAAAPSPVTHHPSPVTLSPPPRASPAARRLARELGVPLSQLAGSGPRGEITRADVERFAASGAVSAGAGVGRLEPAFLERLRRDGAALRGLSSDEKVELYRRHGAVIGEGVRIERGALIVAGEIRIGAASTIGADASVECESFALGRLCAFGKRARVSCRSLQVGDALWAKDDVTIGGGGSHEPGARLTVGDAAFIGEAAYLNPCHPVTLGDEVCVGARAMLFTHSHWQSILRGYASLFGPIEVGDHVFIGNSVFVFPGVSIGSGATVVVNSFVGLNVPASTLVGGVPARVIRHVAVPPRDEQVRLFRERLAGLPPLLEAAGHRVERRQEGDTTVFDLGAAGTICFGPHWPLRAPRPGRSVLISFVEEPSPAVPPGTTLFDLHGSRVLGEQDLLSDEMREFCRRLGIRFRPFAWRYRVGHFEGERFVGR